MFAKITIALVLGLTAASASTALALAGQGRQTQAPPWSFACTTDHGPSPCGEPMWVYGRAE